MPPKTRSSTSQKRRKTSAPNPSISIESSQSIETPRSLSHVPLDCPAGLIHEINGSLHLPIELLSYILKEMMLPASYCDLRFKTHKVISPPIECRHQKLVKNADDIRKDRITIMLVCRHWTRIARSHSYLYRDLIVTSSRQNRLVNTHLDQNLRRNDYDAYCQHIKRVRRIDIAFSSLSRGPSLVGAAAAPSSSSTTTGSRRPTRPQINPQLETMLLLNRFSVSPVSITHQPYRVSPPSPSVSVHRPSNPLGSRLRHLNISVNAVSLPVVFQVVSGCESLERLGLFNVTVPRSSTTSTNTPAYRAMKNLKTLQLKINWRPAQSAATWSSPWLSKMFDNGLALPKLCRLRIHGSESGVPVPINFIHLLSSHAPIQQLDIEGNVGSTLPARLVGTPWGNSLRQLEISVAGREDIQALESFDHLQSLEVLVINGLADIIVPPSSSQYSTPTAIREEVAAKETWLNEIFEKAQRFCKQGSINNLVIGDLGETTDTFGDAWRVIARHTRSLETQKIRVWARRNRSCTPTRANDYIDNGRGQVLEEWRQEYLRMPAVAIS